MAIRIGHASTSAPSSGSYKDEVRIASYYKGLSPTVVLRPTSSILAEKSALACEAGCNNDCIEYSQSSRNSLKTAAEKVDYDLASITTRCYADCSSFMTVCAIAGGATFTYGYDNGTNAPTTRNMSTWFTSSGDYTALTNSIYLEGTDYLKRGDILVKEGSHTVMVLDNGAKASDTNTGAISITDQIADSLAYKLTVNIDTITTSELKVNAEVVKIEGSAEKSITKTELLKIYNYWYYSVKELQQEDAILSPDNVKLEANNITFTVDLAKLNANKVYAITVGVKDATGKKTLSAPKMLFKVPASMKTAVMAIDSNIKQPAKKVGMMLLKTGTGFKNTLLYTKNNT